MEPSSPAACASRILETVPLVMQFVRAEMRSRRGPRISVPQFRSLRFLERNPGGSPSDVAEWMGLTLPAASRLIDGLVENGLLTREGSSVDRRRIHLRLTARGRDLVRSARAGTLARLAEVLEPLPKDRRAAVAEAMDALRLAFSPRPSEGKVEAG